MAKDGGPTKAARHRPFQDPGKAAWCSVEVSKTVLWPESVRVERCVELCEARGRVRRRMQRKREGASARHQRAARGTVPRGLG